MKNLLEKMLGNYQLKRVLGRGRMGIVYLADDKALQRPTALKLMDWSMDRKSEQDPVKWFLSEARSVARISHPNVIQIYNIARHGEYRYIAMEYVEGESAEMALDRKGRLSVHRATDILIQTCDALEAAHSAGVIHRDIKPANLLLRKDGVVKLSDFGMAMSSSAKAIFSANMRVGTPFFNAPETWEGRPASPASDIYALGVTYFLLLTGKLPFDAKNMQELQQAHQAQKPADPRNFVSDLPAMCHEITSRCLSKKEYHRFSSAKELENMARALCEQLEKGNTRSYAVSTSGDKVDGIPHAEYEKADGFWLDDLHFTLAPFSSVNPLDLPWLGEPFLGTLASLNDLVSQKKPVICIHGEQGAGKSTLLQRHAMQLSTDFVALYLGRKKGDKSICAVGQLCKLSGIHPDHQSVLTELAQWLTSLAVDPPKHILLYLDEIIESRAEVEKLETIIQRVSRTVGCTAIICTKTDTLTTMIPISSTRSHPMLHLPSLEPQTVIAYAKSWIQKTRASPSPMLLMTTDAYLWIAYKSRGNLKQINKYMRWVLRLAARDNLKVISTREIQICGQHLEQGNQTLYAIPDTLTDWPVLEMRQTLNLLRQSIGIRPLSPVCSDSKPKVLQKRRK